jgi:hypothetical protein
MAYQNLSRQELQDELNSRFYRKKEDKKARGWTFNKSNETLRGYLQELDVQPVRDTAFTIQRNNAIAQGMPKSIRSKQGVQQWINERQQQAQRVLRIEQLKNQLAIDPMNSFNELSRLGYNFTEADVDRLFTNVQGRFLITMKFFDGREKQFTLTRENVRKLRSILISKVAVTSTNTYGSDSFADYDGEPIESFEINEVRGNNARRFNGFFEYLNKTDIPLEKYQIYTVESRDETEDECCVLFALKQQGIEEDKLQKIVSMMGALKTNIPLSKMGEISKIIEKKIIMYYFDEKETKRANRFHKYGDEFNEVVELAQFRNHIFAYQTEPYTAHYITHKNEIDEIYNNKPNKIKKELLTSHMRKDKLNIQSQNPKHISSLDLVVKLFNNGYFSEYNTDLTREFSNNYVLKPSLVNMNVEQHSVSSCNDKKDDRRTIYLFGDTEADVTGKVHEMIAFGFCDIEGNYRKVVYSVDKQKFTSSIIASVKSMLKGLEYDEKNDDVVMFFHNLKYDATLFHDLLYCGGECVKDNQVYSKTFYFGNTRIEFRDSFKHFGGKLSNASKTFDLGVSKGEAIAYEFHTKDNISSNEPVHIKKYMKYLTDDERAIFKSEAKIENERFNATWYYLNYLQKDVEVLRLAMLKYRKLINDITGLDAFEYLTISSIGFNYALKEGCFDGLVETRGSLRQFIQQSVKGGRVYVNPEFQNKEVDECIEDFDGVSLYPSSMKRLCNEFGLPMGRIQQGTERTFDYYESKDWYIVKIILNKINKKQQVPCVSIHNDDGSLEYVNEISKPIELYVDRITLNDYITFHDIEYEIVEGIYWENGFNKKLGEVVTKLHNERNLYKKSNKPKADMIKLIMNSIYGKTGMRISETKTVFKANEKADKYIYNHFGTIEEIQRTPFNTRIIERVCDDSYNMNFVASAILSMSKRIMNEVFSIMNDKKQPVYYTDTDSIHMLQKDVKELGAEYKLKYNRDLIGKDLGQFHTDFEMSGCKDVYSIKHIPIATKTYLDVLVGKNDNDEIVHGTHIRIKGITESGINYELQQRMNEHGIDKVQASVNLFKDLAQGKKVKFYLNPTDHNVSFEFKNGQVLTRPTQSFQRILNDRK